MEVYFQINAGEGACVALSGDPPPTFNTGDTQVQCREEEAIPLWREKVPCSLPTQLPFSTEHLPKEAGPPPSPHCCQDNFGVGISNLILPSPMASKRTRLKVKGTLCHILTAKGLEVSSKAGLSKGQRTMTFRH